MESQLLVVGFHFLLGQGLLKLSFECWLVFDCKVSAYIHRALPCAEIGFGSDSNFAKESTGLDREVCSEVHGGGKREVADEEVRCN